MESNVVSWFEIPVTDMARAIEFYKSVFGYEMQHTVMGDLEMAWFPWADNGTGAGGSLVKHAAYYKPSADGTLVYLSSPSGDLSHELARVADAGGQVLMEKKLIAENYGYMALILDSEGNRVALHSRQ